MEIEELSLQFENKFIDELIHNNLTNTDFFHYSIHSDSVYEDRLADIKNHSYPRQQLVDYLLKYNERFHSPETNVNIKKLLDPSSSVVIGGQQSGLLTGPLYTIHKIISIIQLAKEQERNLQKPVIPVFWIAGEDHDFDEINHVFVPSNGRMKKKGISQRQIGKTSVASMQLDHRQCGEWIKEIVEGFGETDHSNELIKFLENCMKRSDTYVQFFEEIVMWFFKEDGLILINSGDLELRKIEQPFFKRLSKNSMEMQSALQQQQKFMVELGYKPIIQSQPNSANIFYEYDGERILLKKEQAVFVAPEVGLTLTENEMDDLIQTKPHLFSNNVVTRPLMQEFLFPTLAFIGGYGEIHYWAELKQVFEKMKIKMPPVVPRLNITFLERPIEREIDELSLSLTTVLNKGVADEMDNWISMNTPIPISPLVAETKQKVDSLHAELRNAAIQIDQSLEGLMKKNAYFIQKQLEFAEQAVEKQIKLKLENDISKFQRVEMSLKPEGRLQERMWNLVYFLNKYGPDILKKVKNLSYSFNNQHKVVKL
ncbi:bacillithiol biosynthesis cysteine-adding enzyme BshC [Metabacillus arenae]|uniref:Putative cysteine ligase BshC n=1 Tax=Metabacillus arenae TaxID=2771434 RepID=A0A926RVP9_9BACI|nr:bacillithiol biosynthesis cysteine-adding enzyme BshC [Metabacillus arenae]MBD1379923.1 bacillithiol biosynthesis cysteine-adding enzyme BshC [Metabacillus arenae]